MILGDGTPRFCYGHDTYEPQFAGMSFIDLFTPQLHVRSVSQHRTTAVSAITCMPFHSTMLTGGLHRGHAAANSSDDGGGSIVTLYANGTAPWLPSQPLFSFPNWCTFAGPEHEAQRELLQECGL